MNANSIGECNICYYPLNDSYNRNNCNDQCNQKFAVHKDCYSRAMSIRINNFSNNRCFRCNAVDPEGPKRGISSKIFDLFQKNEFLQIRGLAMLSTALSIVSMFSIAYLDTMRQNCFRNNRTMCGISVAAGEFALAVSTLVIYAPPAIAYLSFGVISGIIEINNRCRNIIRY